MRIGEFSTRTGVPPRMLRHYEKQGLIQTERQTNGYRDYGEDLVDRVEQIRGLIEAGVPTSIIRQLTPCLDSPDEIVLHQDCPEIIERLERQRDLLSGRVECLTHNRDAITAYIDAVRSATPSR